MSVGNNPSIGQSVPVPEYYAIDEHYRKQAEKKSRDCQPVQASPGRLRSYVHREGFKSGTMCYKNRKAFDIWFVVEAL
ncbi:hypothetical protein BWI93_04435 [Siphonobacter sp. BAB-5385]|nr:hypothetical protein BWI93_04435 [Siphonobacter sp. BAB-5385]